MHEETKLIQPVPVVCDEMGSFQHPDMPDFDEGYGQRQYWPDPVDVLGELPMASTVSYELVLHRYPTAQEWLGLLGNLGRAPATLDAYGRGLTHYLGHCEASGLAAGAVTFEQVTLYIRRLLPVQENAVANSTLHQCLTVIRLWYDYLDFQGVCEQNPVQGAPLANGHYRWKRTKAVYRIVQENRGDSRFCSTRVINRVAVLPRARNGRGHEALGQGAHSAAVILNIVARRREIAAPITTMTPEALKLKHAPTADCAR